MPYNPYTGVSAADVANDELNSFAGAPLRGEPLRGVSPFSDEPDPDSLVAAMRSSQAYRLDQMRKASEPRTAFFKSGVNYLNAPDDDPVARAAHITDYLTLDIDKDGTKTALYGEAHGLPWDKNTVAVVNVFGKAMSRSYLEKFDAGRELLALVERQRKGMQRGFREAILDFQVSDAPFFGMIASVDKSIEDAVTVSSTFSRLQDGVGVSDEDLIKTRLYMAKNERNSNGTWGATFGDIVRQAPGFMMEFLASGTTLSALRKTAVKELGEDAGVHLGIVRGAKVLGRELTQEGMGELLEQTGKRALTEVTDKAAVQTVEKKVAKGIFDYMAREEFKELYKGMTKEAMQSLADKRAALETARFMARTEGRALSRGMNQFGQWFTSHASRGLLDFGAWGTEEATVLFTGRSTAGRALADAAGALFVEAPFKGAMLYAPKKFVYNPVIGAVWGKDGQVVTQQELQIRQSALLNDNPDLMADAEVISFGMELMEYVSENTGRGFKSLARAGGLGLEKLGVRGLVRPVRRMNLSTGLFEGEEGYWIGGRLRDMVNKAIGTRSDHIKAMTGREVDAVVAKLGGDVDAVTRGRIQAAIAANSADQLPEALRSVIGTDVQKFVKQAVSESYDKLLRDHQYKTFARFALADWMTRHNYGPQTVMNVFDQMGYDGVMGEMFEERYADVVNGLLGLDEQGETKWMFGHENTRFVENLKNAVKGLYPGWDQLTAEAVGFAMPGVVRAGIMRAQNAVGGAGPLLEMRAKLDVLQDATRVSNIVQMEHGKYLAVFENLQAKDRADITELEAQRQRAVDAGDNETAEAMGERIDQLKKVVDRRQERHSKFEASLGSLAEDNAALVAVPFATAAELSDDFRYKTLPVFTAAQAEASLTGRDALVEYAPTLARQLAESQIMLEGEKPSWYRYAAHKILGIAGAFVTGDLSLAAANPAQWTAEDMGLARVSVGQLRDGFRNTYSEVRREMAGRGPTTQAAVLDEAQRRFAPKAREIMAANVSASQFRSFANEKMRDEALAFYAAHYSEEGDPRAYNYSVGADGKVSFYKLASDGQSVDESTVVSAEKFYQDHKAEADKVYDDFLAATTDLLARGFTTALDDRAGLVKALTLAVKSKTDLAQIAVYDAAARMVGTSDVLYRVQTDTGDAPIGEIIRSGAVGQATMDVIDYISGKSSLDEVDGRAFESVAKSMHWEFDGTEAGLKARNGKIFRAAKMATTLRRQGVEFFSRQILEQDGLDARLSPNGLNTVEAVQNADGTWQYRAGLNEDGSRKYEKFDTHDQMVADLQARGYIKDSARVVFTQAKVIESKDMFHMLRQLRLGREYYELLGGADVREDRLHPYLRHVLDEEGRVTDELVDEDEAERTLMQELAAAEKARNAAPGSAEAQLRDRVWGRDGYMAIGERLLERVGVTKDTAVKVVGEFKDYAPSRYTLKMSSGRVPGSADVYVNVDPSVHADTTDAILHGVLLQAYASRPRFFWNESGSVLSEFARGVSRIVDDAVEEAVAAKDEELAGQLRAFRAEYLSNVDAVAREKNRMVVRKGAGFTPGAFVQLAGSFVLNRAEKYRENPFTRAVSTIADRVRRLPSFIDFMNVTDLALGGNGFLSEAVREANKSEADMAELRGVQRLMAYAEDDPATMKKALVASLPAGSSYAEFLDKAMRRATAFVKAGTVAEKERETLRAEAAAADSASGSATEQVRAHFNFMGHVVGVLKAAIDKARAGGDVAPSFTDFMAGLAEEAANDPSATPAQKKAAAGMLAALRKLGSAQSPVERVVSAANANADAATRRNEARAAVIETTARLEEARANAEAASTSELPGLDLDALASEQEQRRQELAQREQEQQAAAANLTEALRSAEAEGVQPEVFAGMFAGNSDVDVIEPDVTTVAADVVDVDTDDSGVYEPSDEDSEDDEDDPAVEGLGNAGADVPKMPGELQRSEGFRILHGMATRFEDRRLTPAQASLAVSVAVRALLANGSVVTDRDVDRVAAELFPNATIDDRREIQAAYRRIDDDRVRARAEWNAVSRTGRWDGLQEDKADEDVSSDDYNRLAVDEYTSKYMKDFLTLARLSSSETSGNFQAFARLLREGTRLGAEGDAAQFMRRLLNPRLATDATTQAQFASLLRETLVEFETGAADKYIKEFMGRNEFGFMKSRRSAFLLSYMASLDRNARVRFGMLLANSVSATPIRMTDSHGTERFETVSRYRGQRLPEAVVVEAFSSLVGRTGESAARMHDALAEAFDPKNLQGMVTAPGGRGDSASRNRAANIAAIRTNGKIIAAALAKVLGPENPLVSALTSGMTLGYLASPAAKENTIASVALDLSFRGYEEGKPPSVAFADVIIDALDTLSHMKGTILPTDIAAVMVGALTSGSKTGAGLARATARADITTSVFTLMASFQDGLPETVMGAESDQRANTRGTTSVAVAPRDLVPLVAKWLFATDATAATYKDGTKARTFESLCREFFPDVTDEVLAECHQDATWPDEARTPICAKCITSGRSATDVLKACEASYAMGDGASNWVPLFSGDHSSVTLVQLPRAVQFAQAAAEQPVETRVSGAKDLVVAAAEDNFQKLSDINDKQDLRDLLHEALQEVEEKSGKEDRAAAITRLAEELTSDNLTDEELSGFDTPEIGRRVLADLRAKVLDAYGKKAPVQAQAKPKKQTYDEFAESVYAALGMPLLYTDAKRSALSSLEAQGTGLIGSRKNADGTRTWGENRVHILRNWAFRSPSYQFTGKHGYQKKADEAFLGSTFMYGYGAKALREMSMDPGSSLLKTHIISTDGADLFFIKSLSVATGERGQFTEGSANRAIMDYLQKRRGSDTLSTDIFTDRDSYKIGPAGSKVMKGSVTVNGKTYSGQLMDIVYDALYDAALADAGLAPDTPVTDKAVAKALETKYGNGITGDELDTVLGEVKVSDTVRGDRTAKMSELLPGLDVRTVTGLNGACLDLSYQESGAMAYQVANVSHPSTVPREAGKAARNYEIDAMTMAASLLRNGVDNPACDRVLDLVSNWGLMANLVYSMPSYVKALRQRADHYRELVRNGESPAGQFALDELARQVQAEIRQASNLPFAGVDMALVSSGASIDDNGRLFSHSTSEMHRGFMRGSELFTEAERDFYGQARRPAFCNINYDDPTFRYSWFLDEAAFNREFEKDESQGGFIHIIDEAVEAKGGNVSPGQRVALGLAAVFTYLRDIGNGEDAADRKKECESLRRRIASCFLDHHGQRISERGKSYVSHFGFDDLFRMDGTFDLSAVSCEDRDRIYNDATGDVNGHIVLGGTMFGVPRTPSYNGSMWLQVARAGLPVTEIEEETRKGKRYRVGGDAMIQPDPYTNAILGCDHDGDKTKAYILRQSDTGLLRTLMPPDLDVRADKFGRDQRDALVRKIAATKTQGGTARAFLDRWRVDPETGAEVRVEDTEPESPDDYFKISEGVRTRVSNAFVQSLFEMWRELPVYDLLEHDDGSLERKERYSPETGERVKFLSPYGVTSSPTKATPVGLEYDDDMKSNGRPAILSEKNTVGKPKVGARVTDSARDSSDARGNAVSIARSLHVAWTTGMFRDLFRNSLTNSDEWTRFMYHLDGISNATFDDVKEQICNRMGWTKDLMDSVVTSLLQYGVSTRDGLPVTDKAFHDLLSGFARNIRDGGGFYWALLAARPAGVPETLGGEVKTFKDVLQLAGFKGNVSDDTFVTYEGLVSLLQVEEVDTIGWLTTNNAVINEIQRQKIKGERLLRDAAVAGGHNVVFGHLAYTLAHPEYAKKFADWYKARNELSSARAFGRSLTYLVADPGAPNAAGQAAKDADAWDRQMWYYDKHEKKYVYKFAPPIGEYDVDTAWNRMRLASSLAYDIGQDLRTISSQAVKAGQDSNAAVVRMYEATVATQNDRDLATELFLRDALPSWDRAGLEANAKQLPYLVGFLRALPALPIAGKGFKNGAEAFDALSVLADSQLAGLAGLYDDLAEKTKDDKDYAKFNKDKAEELRGRAAELDGHGTVLHLRHAIESLYGIMHELVVTSEEFMAPGGNKAFAYLRANGDTAFGRVEEKKFSGQYDEVTGEPKVDKVEWHPYGLEGDGLVRIQPMFRTGDAAMREGAQRFFADVIGGRAFAGDTRRLSGKPNLTQCRTFTLSERSIVAYAKELGSKATAEQGARIREALAALRALSAVGITEVTPAMMMGQLIPIYSLLTSTTTGTPTETSVSLMSLLPNKYYETISKYEARTANDPAMVAARGRNYNPVADPKPAKKGEDYVRRFRKRRAGIDRELVRKALDTGDRDVAKSLGLETPEGREQPDFRHTMDVVSDKVVRLLVERAAPKPVANEDKPVRETLLKKGSAYDERTANLARVMGAALASWADVEYTGGKAFAIRGKLRGAAGAGRQVSIVVDTAGDAVTSDTEAGIDALANSRAFASSLCATADLGIEGRPFTAEDFMRLPLELRKAFARKYRIGAATSNKIEWSFSGKGLATLAGAIRLPGTGASDTKLYHEYFHSMMRMFEHIGLFAERDYAAFRQQFGEDRSGRRRFNEEAAAEAFRKWMENGTIENEKKGTRNVFRWILDFLTAFWKSLTQGFRYSGDASDTTLFKMMVHGIAEPSLARADEAREARMAELGKSIGSVKHAVRNETDEKKREALEARLEKLQQSYRKVHDNDAVAMASVMARDFAPEALPKDQQRTRSQLEDAALANAEAVRFGGKVAEFDQSPRWTADSAAQLREASAPEEARVLRFLNGETDMPFAEFRVALSRVAGARQQAAGETREVPAAVDEEDLAMAEPAPESVPGSNEAKDAEIREHAKAARLPVSEVNDFYATARWIAESMEAGLREDGSWKEGLQYITRKYAVSDRNGPEIARDRQVVMNGLKQALATVNPEAVRKLGETSLEKSLAFQAALSMYHVMESSFIRQNNVNQAGESMPANPLGYDKPRGVSAFQVSAWVLSADAAAPTRISAEARDTVARYMRQDGVTEEEKNELQLHYDMMEKVANLVKDPGSLMEYRRSQGTDVLNEVIGRLRAGTKGGTLDGNGFMRDFEPISDESATKNPHSADHLKTFRPAWKSALVQKSLKQCLAAAYQVAAMAKFYQETGTEAATADDIEFQKTVMARHNIPAGISFADWMATQAIGDSDLADNRGLVDYMDQPYFIADNVDAWVSSLVRKSFGAKNGIGEMLMAENHEYAALKGAISRLENLHAFRFGDNVEAGGEILKLLDHRAEFALEDGQVVNKVGDKYEKYDNYRRVGCGLRMTESDLRVVDIYKKMLAAYAAGQRGVVTGLNDIRFSDRMSRDKAFYSREAVAERKRNGEQLDALSMALYRAPSQIPPEILDTYYDEFVDAALRAMDEAERIGEEEAISLAGRSGRPEDYFGEKEHVAESRYNARVIEALERDGYVVGVNKNGAKFDIGGTPMYTSAIITIGCDRINDLFKSSAVYAKLTSEKGGRTAEMLDRDTCVKELMGVYKDTVRFVKQHPWLTHGDGKYFHGFGTELPFWRGSGVFMYNAERVLRNKQFESETKMSNELQAMRDALASEDADRRLADVGIKKLAGALDMLGSVFRLGTAGQPLLDSIARGDYAPGTDRAKRTGLELDADATYADLAETLYKKSLDDVWEHQFGDPSKAYLDLRAASEIVDMYRDASLTRGEVFGGAIGLNDEQMARKTGTLPANYQLGHKVHKAIDGITNAMMARSTLANMLMTPASDGAPVYYADPSDIAANVSGLDDSFWKQLARWWCEYNGDEYDEKLSGVANAKKEYAALRAKSVENKGFLGTSKETLARYVEHSDQAGDVASVERWLVRDDDPDDGTSLLNRLQRGEAMGYLRQFLGAGRVLGMGGSGVRATLHRALSWSKTMSVSFSRFFPLATRYESPIGAVGAVATLCGNNPRMDEWVKKNPELFARIQKMFGGKGWITKGFLGFNDILEMMDSNDPFLAEMYAWASALGVTVSTSLVSPMENSAAVTKADMDKLKNMIRDQYGAEVAGKFGRIADALTTRSADKAFNYALNATKLAVIAQFAMKMRYEAQRQGKAFDPIRDLRRYSGYINAEVGGIDPLKYAYATPMFRELMNGLMFSWSWTRGAWEAGGGGVIEDMLFGGHNMTRQERAVLPGRWIRMFGAVMLAWPQILQIMSMAFAKILDGISDGFGDDDDDLTDEEFAAKNHRDRTRAENRRHRARRSKWTREEFRRHYGRNRTKEELLEYAEAHNPRNRDVWFTWQNEDKAKWTAADVTPLLKAIGRFDDTLLGGISRSFKERGRKGSAAVGAATGAILGSVNGGNWLTGAISAGLGAMAGSTAPGLIPLYTGDGVFNPTGAMRTYFNSGKQGWEFIRYFTDWKGQLISKQSMPLQRFEEGFFGRSLGYLERALPWENMGPTERWLNLTSDGALWNLAQAFVPFSLGGMDRSPDAGILPIFGVVSTGKSHTRAQKELKKSLKAWAENDRGQYRFGAGSGRARRHVSDILRDVERNGYDPDQELQTALREIRAEKYRELFRLAPKEGDEAYDATRMNRVARQIRRLDGRLDSVAKSLKTKYENADRIAGRPSAAVRRWRYEIVRQSMERPTTPMRFAPAVGPDVEVREAANGGSNLGNFLATDKVPDTIFGIPVTQDPQTYTREDLAFFKDHPEAAGYYQLEGDSDEQ